jgi:nitrite reductase (NO-forming)
MDTKTSNDNDYSLWADTAAGAIRAAFGLAWAMDAYLKWRPGFFNDYLSYISGIINGQPKWLLPWFNLWSSLIRPDPNLFAWLTRLIETAIALGLLLGIARKWVYVLGGLFALLIWSVPEGFGGPYVPGSTDVGGGLIYIFMFIALIIIDYVLGRSPYSVDFYIEKRIPSWRFLAEWAPPKILAQEPRRLPWNIQIVTIIGLVIMLAIFLVVLASEINSAAATQGSIPGVVQMVFLQHVPQN